MLVAIVLLSASLRLGSSGVVEFKRDEANLSQLALDMANGRSFPLLGIGSSVGVPNAPFNVYILAIPYLISSSPLTATQFIELLNIIAVVLVYCLAWRYCGIVAAITASLIYAVSPWGVIFSRKIWAQDMLPLFFLLTLGSGFLGFVERRRIAQAAFFPLLVITGQIHYGAFVILPAALWLFWHGYRQRTLTRALGVGCVIAVILVIPYAVGVLQASRSAGGLQTLLSSSPQMGTTSKLHLTDEAMRGAALMIAGTEIHSLAGTEMFQEYLASVPDVYPLFQLLTLAVIFSSLWLIARLFREKDRRTSIDVLLLLWLIAPIIFFSVNWTPFYIHYLIPMLPAAYLVVGFAAQDAWKWLASRRTIQRVSFAVAFSGLVIILGFQVVLWLALLRFLDTYPTPGGFGTPLHYLMDVREAILRNQPQQVVGRLDGQTIGIDDEATVWNVLLDDVPLVRFEDANTRVYPLDSVVYLSNNCDSGFDGERFLLREDEGCYHLSSITQSDFDASGYEAIALDQPTRFANGVDILQYRWSEPCLSLLWRITQLTTTDYQFAGHFFDLEGNRIAMADGLSWLGRYWYPGDLVERTFCLPEGNPQIENAKIGMYTYDGVNFFNVDLVDLNGLPVGQMIDLPLP